jgi:D-alanine-D-alanine ligase
MYKVVVIYGGKSPEHDVSVLTALHLVKHITDGYRVRPVYITRENRFVFGSGNIDDYISGKASKAAECRFANGALYKCGVLGRKVMNVDCVINCCHGGAGESGELAALMKIAGIPMTGCGTISAYNQQSKTETRKILTAHGFVQPKFVAILKFEYDYLNERVAELVKLPFPVIVKPNMLGSSIGISAARTREELVDALHLAFTCCGEAIVEEFIEDMKEVNIAVMRHKGELIVSGAETVGSGQVFSFEEKYLNPSGGFIKKSAAEAEEDLFLQKVVPQVAKLAKSAYEIFGSGGMVRTDCMVKGDKIILNENNTVPGFMAYHLWLRAGVPYGVVIDNMVREAMDKANESALITEFSSDILQRNKQLVVE